MITTLKSRHMRALAAAAMLSLALAAGAQVSVSGGGGQGCTEAVLEVTRHWFELSRYMIPANVKIERPGTQDFFCISPYYLKDSIERRTVTSARVRCFSNPQGGPHGVCCDEELAGCAQINPALAPDPAAEAKAPRTHKRPKSGWVRPPTDDDQWQSVDNE